MNVHDEAAALARSVFDLRRQRARHLPEAVLSEVSWNILLGLFVADADGRRISGREAIELAEVAPATGKRWINVLSEAGLVEGGRSVDLDNVITLTPAGISAVEACMIDAQQYLRTQISRADDFPMQRV